MDLDATQVLEINVSDDEEEQSFGKKIGQLDIISGLDEESFQIMQGDNLIGRSPCCQVFLPKNSLSREHARISASNKGCFIFDNNSQNKTRLGKKILVPDVGYELSDGIEITFGDVVARFILTEEADESLEDTKLVDLEKETCESAPTEREPNKDLEDTSIISDVHICDSSVKNDSIFVPETMDYDIVTETPFISRQKDNLDKTDISDEDVIVESSDECEVTESLNFEKVTDPIESAMNEQTQNYEITSDQQSSSIEFIAEKTKTTPQQTIAYDLQTADKPELINMCEVSPVNDAVSDQDAIENRTKPENNPTTQPYVLDIENTSNPEVVGQPTNSSGNDIAADEVKDEIVVPSVPDDQSIEVHKEIKSESQMESNSTASVSNVHLDGPSDSVTTATLIDADKVDENDMQQISAGQVQDEDVTPSTASVEQDTNEEFPFKKLDSDSTLEIPNDNVRKDSFLSPALKCKLGRKTPSPAQKKSKAAAQPLFADMDEEFSDNDSTLITQSQSDRIDISLSKIRTPVKTRTSCLESEETEDKDSQSPPISSTIPQLKRTSGRPAKVPKIKFSEDIINLETGSIQVKKIKSRDVSKSPDEGHHPIKNEHSTDNDQLDDASNEDIQTVTKKSSRTSSKKTPDNDPLNDPSNEEVAVVNKKSAKTSLKKSQEDKKRSEKQTKPNQAKKSAALSKRKQLPKEDSNENIEQKSEEISSPPKRSRRSTDKKHEVKKQDNKEAAPKRNIRSIDNAENDFTENKVKKTKGRPKKAQGDIDVQSQKSPLVKNVDASKKLSLSKGNTEESSPKPTKSSTLNNNRKRNKNVSDDLPSSPEISIIEKRTRKRKSQKADNTLNASSESIPERTTRQVKKSKTDAPVKSFPEKSPRRNRVQSLNNNDQPPSTLKESKPINSPRASKRTQVKESSKKPTSKSPVPKKTRSSISTETVGKKLESRTLVQVKRISSPRKQSSPAKSNISQSDNVKIMFTLLPPNELKSLQKQVEKLGGSVTDDVYQCTHLVTNAVKRTFKFLCCMGRGIPIVNPSWIKSSTAAGDFVPPAKHQLKDPQGEKEFKISLSKSLRKSQSLLSVLNGWTVYCTKSVLPPPDQLKDIVTCAGATYKGIIASKLPSFDKKDFDLHVLITCAEDKKPIFSKLPFPRVTKDFLLQSILAQEVLDVKKYSIL